MTMYRDYEWEFDDPKLYEEIPDKCPLVKYETT
jgi:hypothetical protein